MSALAELFPDEDFRFHLALKRSTAAAFFRPSENGAALLAERQHWLATHPARHAALLPAGDSLRAAFAELVGQPPHVSVLELGQRLEPDFLLLAPEGNGLPILVGGSLCFPTGWALEEQVGRPVRAIHGIVPGLNDSMGGAIDQFLARLKPEVGYERANWGLAATAELNLHPALKRPRLTAPLDFAKVWLRVERQYLGGLPGNAGVLFAIRVQVYPLHEVVADPGVRHGLRRALLTMTEPVAAYKGLTPVRDDLVRYLT